MISSVSEQFYQTMPDRPELKKLSDFELNITAANGISVPYSGYIEVEVAIPHLKDGSIWVLMLVVRDTEYNIEVPSIIGMNLIREFSRVCPSTEKLNIPTVWKTAFEVSAMTNVGVVKSTKEVTI